MTFNKETILNCKEAIASNEAIITAISLLLLKTPQDCAQVQAYHMTIKTTKAQRAVVVHACNGNRKQARKWLVKFSERSTDQLEYLLEVDDFNFVVNRPDDTVERHTTKEGTDRAYKEACDTFMRIYNNLKRLVDGM